MKLLTRARQKTGICTVAIVADIFVTMNAHIPKEESNYLIRRQAECLVDLADIIGGVDGMKAINIALEKIKARRKCEEEPACD
jgi:hypothetical protein